MSTPLMQCPTPMYFVSLPRATQWMQMPVPGMHVLLQKSISKELFVSMAFY